MLKTTAPSIPARLVWVRVDKDRFNIGDGDGIGEKINDRIVNLSSTKMSLGAGFLIPKASLAFTQLRKMFTEAPILYYFNLEHHIRIETDTSGYAISGVLSQLTSETGLAGQMTHKPNPLSEIGR